MNKNKICRFCLYNQYNRQDGDNSCICKDSEKFGWWTNENWTCEKWEDRMATIKEKVRIPNIDYDELNSSKSRWTKDQYAYFVAKFKTMYPAEGYGMFGVRTMQDDDGLCYICWDHYDSCD